MSDRRQKLIENRDKLFEYLDKYEFPTPKSIINPKPAENPVKYDRDCIITVEDADTISAAWEIRKDPDAKIAILNFASFRHPGGGFMTGAMAQEESICHHTNLYHALAAQKKWYDENERMINRCLYQNRSILTRDVSIVARGIGEFVDPDEVFQADFLTCACPNCGAAMKKGVSESEINRAIGERVHYLLETLAGRGCTNIILGAFGCGAFRCNPKVVANAFKIGLTGEFAKSFDNVVFAVPDGRNGNLAVFKEVLGK